MLNEKISVKEFLNSLKNTALNAYANQDIPFEKLVEAMKVERSLSYSPLFQVMFTLQEAPNRAFKLPDIKIEHIDADTHTSKFDLTIFLTNLEKNISGTIEYNTDLFEPEAIERMAGHYRQLLSGMVAHADQPVMDLSLLSDQETQQILFDWNRTEADYPQDLCIHQLFETQAEQTPDAVAVTFEEQQMTYRMLNQRSNQLAHYLIELGVGTDVRVGLYVERSLEMIVGILGIVKAGGAYVPTDPGYPQQRISYLFDNSGMAVLLTQSSLLNKLPDDSSLKTICLDGEWRSVDIHRKHNPAVYISPENLAYIIYTSGSTGKPKGVMCSHKGLVNRLLWMQDTYILTIEDKIIQKTPFSFDVSVWEFFWPLITGASLHFAKKDGHKDPAYLSEQITLHGITTLHFVPSMLEVFVESNSSNNFKKLKRVICSG